MSLAAFAVAYGFFVALSPTFQECIKANSYYPNARPSDYHALIDPLTRLWWCSGVFAKENGEAIAALASVAIAAFTWTLWRATTEQGRLTEKTIKLATREFVSTHRPKIRMRGAVLDAPSEGTPLAIVFELVNVGDTRARILTVQLTATIVGTFQGNPGRQWSRIVPFTDFVQGGEALLTRHITDVVPASKMDIERLRERLWIRGVIQYLDDNGVQRRTAFRRLYSPTSQQILRFRIPEITDPDFEFED